MTAVFVLGTVTDGGSRGPAGRDKPGRAGSPAHRSDAARARRRVERGLDAVAARSPARQRGGLVRPPVAGAPSTDGARTSCSRTASSSSSSRSSEPSASSLFVGSWLLLFRCARGRDRPLSVAAQCVAAVLVIQASVDWTWSFPGLVAAVMLVLGLAAGGSRQSARARPATEAAVVGLAVAALGIFAVPYLSDRALAQASGNQSSRPATALAQARSAIRLYPWDQRAYALEGSIFGSAGDYTAAANAYAEAASRALEPWVQHLDEARTAVQAKRIPLARTACEAALRENPYAVDAVLALCPRPDGRAWPLAAVPAARVAPPFARLLVSRGCDGCRVTVAGGRVSARVAGGFPFEDTAVAVAPLPGRPALEASSTSSCSSRSSAPPPRISCSCEVRDARQRLVFSLFVEGPSRQLIRLQPAGRLRLVLLRRAHRRNRPPRRAGRRRLRRPSPEHVRRVSGRRTARPPLPRLCSTHSVPCAHRRACEVEAGIDGYDSSRLDDPIEVTIRGLRAGVSPARRIGG